MGKDRKVKIVATPNASAKGGYDFEMQVNGKQEGMLEFNKFHDNMKKSESYRIEFDLQNKGSKAEALRFSKLEDTVLWAKAVDDLREPCPESPSYMPNVFFVDPDSRIEDEKLVVINVDPDVQDFKFAFNFLRPGQKDGPNTDYARFDPIGSNQNGGVPMMNASIALCAAVGVGVAAMAFLAFRAWA